MASKRNRRAPVWTYMEQTMPDKVMCLVCKDSLKYNGNTSNMIKHIRTKHPIEYTDMKEDSGEVDKSGRLPDPMPGTSTATMQPTLMQTIDRKQSYTDGSDKKKELDLLFMKIIVKNLHPLSDR